MTYVMVDGQRLASAVAHDYGRMEAAFRDETGFDLIVTSGTRTTQEQIDIFLSRYVTAANINGRRVYDTRMWNGILYYRVSAAGTVAVPGTSNHEENGPIGPRAIDIRDSGADAGVTTRGTARDRWMERNAGRFNFKNAGYNFGEPWHKEWTGGDPHGGSTAGGAVGDPAIKAIQHWLNVAFGAGLVEDGILGELTKAAISRYQVVLGVTPDGAWGPLTQAAHDVYYQRWLAAQAGGTPPFPLGLTQYYGPEAGGDNSISGWHHPSGTGDPGLKQWQQRVKDRGGQITMVDGLYGPKGATTPQGETAAAARALQKEWRLPEDSLIGPQTWAAAWTTPADPVTPTPDPKPEPEPDPGPTIPPLVTPTAADFPPWIRYEEKLDPEAQAEDYAAKWEAYYKKPYLPIESHTHWWGAPDAGYTHDGTVSHLMATPNLGANYVTSAGRITLLVPLSLNALTTGQRNPYAWKSENDGKITTATDDLGYKTLGYLHYIVEKLNPRLAGEPVRLHKEFYPTQCSDIDVAKVRKYADDFRTGALDPATGNPPVTSPGVICVPVELAKQIKHVIAEAFPGG